jgi:DNA-directed RNA polymerase subunit RPC12/RpoP
VLTNAAENNWIHHVYFGVHLGSFVTLFILGLLATPPMGVRYIILSLLIGLLYFPVNATTLRPVLRRRLYNRHGIPYVCFECGHRFLGVAHAACPSCGSAVPLKNDHKQTRRP